MIARFPDSIFSANALEKLLQRNWAGQKLLYSMSTLSFRSQVEVHYPEALRFLRSLVETNSHFSNVEGVEENARRVIRQFEPLGFKATRFPPSEAGRANHLFMECGRSDAPAIALISHLDTVFLPEEEQANDFHWREEPDGRIFGPGTIDIKGGTAMMWLTLAALKDIHPQFFDSVRWILAWNAEEETCACVPFGKRCKSVFPDDLLAALVFEMDNEAAEGISLLNARKGISAFKVIVKGRGSHAGARHENGANAVWQIARLIDRAQQLTDYEAGLTVNVGVVKGGTAHNCVPHYAEAELEVRAYNPQAFEQACAQIMALQDQVDVHAARDGYPCSIEVVHLKGVPPWPENPGTQKLLSLWQAAGEKVGSPVTWKPRGGISDGNWLSAHFPTLDALGPAGANAHASERSSDGTKEQEFVYAPSFIPKAEVNLVALQMLVEQRITGRD